MNSFNLTLIIFVGFVSQFLHAYECDTRELRHVRQKEMTAVSSKKFSTEYDQAYSRMFQSIEKLKSKIPVGSDPHAFYLSTRIGQEDVKQLQKLRADFQYDAVTQYLFDDETLNAQKEHYTSIYKQGLKTFYLSRGRLIAVLEQKAYDEYLLTRLNRSCQPFEIVSFTTINHESDSNVRYKITPPLCKAAVTQKRLPATSTFDGTQSYVSDVKDRTTQKGIARDCHLLKGSPAVPPARRKAIAAGMGR